MNSKYLFCLSVECPDGRHYRRALTVNAFEATEFEPYDLCDDPLALLESRSVTRHGAACIDADRRELAEDIAACLTDEILQVIKSQDTVNGYEKREGHEH